MSLDIAFNPPQFEEDVYDGLKMRQFVEEIERLHAILTADTDDEGVAAEVTSFNTRVGDVLSIQTDYDSFYSLLGHTHGSGDLTDFDFTGAADNDMLFRSGGSWIDTAGLLTWDTSTLKVNRKADALTSIQIGEPTTARGNAQNAQILMYGEHVSTIYTAAITVDQDFLNIGGLGGNPITRAAFQVGLDIQSGKTLRVLSPSNGQTGNFSHDGTDFNAAFVNTTSWNITGLTTVEYFADVYNRSGSKLTMWDSTDADTFDLQHTGNHAQITTGGTGGGDLRIATAGGWVDLRSGNGLRIRDSLNTSFVQFSHDSTDFNTAFTSTIDWNITGVTDVKVPALTSTGRIAAPQVNFDVAAGIDVLTGEMAWNADAGTMDVGMLGTDVVLQLGQEMHFHVKATEAVTNGEVVYASGAIGASSKIEVSLFTGDGAVPSHVVLGIATEAIALDAFGYITQFGTVRGLDTTGQGGETWLEGDILYPSPTVAGGLTKVQPTAPEIAMPIAFVVNVHAVNGSIIVRPTPPFSLANLDDVHITSVTDGELLVYNNAQSHWDNQTLTEAGILGLAGGTMAGTISMADNIIDQPTIRDYGITEQVATVSANAVTVDLELGNVASIDMQPATAAVALTLSNPPASGTYGEVTLIITMGTPSQVMTWPGSITWQGASPPTLSTPNNAVDLVHLMTVDGGTTWYGTFATATAPVGFTEVNDLSSAVTWANIPIANVPTGTTGSTVALGNHTHLLAAGATDVTATAAELNLLDLAGLTAGWVLSADTASTASWKAPVGGAEADTLASVTGRGATTATASTFSGGISMADSNLGRPRITDYALTEQVSVVSANAVTVNLQNGNVASIDMDPATADVVMTLSNPPVSGHYGEVTILIVMGTPAHGITWPGSVTWQGGSAPTLSTINNTVDLVHLMTIDGGTTWFGTFALAAAVAGGSFLPLAGGTMTGQTVIDEATNILLDADATTGRASLNTRTIAGVDTKILIRGSSLDKLNFGNAAFDLNMQYNTLTWNGGAAPWLPLTGGTMSGDITSPDKIRLTSAGDAGLATDTHAFQVGLTASGNIIIDNNEIMARDNGAASTLFLNADGGQVNIGNASPGSLMLNGSATIRGGSKLFMFDSTNIDNIEMVHDGANFQINDVTGTGVLRVRNMGLQVEDGQFFRVQNSTDTAFVAFQHDGTNLNISHTGTTNIDVEGPVLRLLSGSDLEIRDSANADTAIFRHDSTDFNLAMTGTTDWNVTGATNIKLGGNVFIGGDTVGHLSAVSGGFGSVECDGAQVGGFDGYNIAGRGVFMWHPTTERGGIYDDVNNRWVMQWNAANASTNEQLGLYVGNSVVAMLTQNPALTGNLSAATVLDGDSVARNIGFATMKEEAFAANRVVDKEDWSQKALTQTGATIRTLTFNTLTTVPNGAVMWVKGEGGEVTLVDGTMVLTLYNGGGGTLPVGNITVAKGGWATIHKTGNSTADVTGVGLS